MSVVDGFWLTLIARHTLADTPPDAIAVGDKLRIEVERVRAPSAPAAVPAAAPSEDMAKGGGHSLKVRARFGVRARVPVRARARARVRV